MTGSPTSFFKFIPPGFKFNLSIPKSFWMKSDNGRCSKAILRRGCHQWPVDINDKGVFSDGWRKFVMENGVQEFDLILFKHQGNMVFDFWVFDQSTCERQYPNQFVKMMVQEPLTESDSIRTHRTTVDLEPSRGTEGVPGTPNSQQPLVDVVASTPVATQQPINQPPVPVPEQVNVVTYLKTYKRRKTVAAKDKQPEEDLSECEDHTGFSSMAAKEMYETLKTKAFIHDKGIHFVCLWTIPYIREVVKGLKWQHVCKIRSGFNISCVKVFYAEAAVSTTRQVTVRGTTVDYSPDSLNAFLEIPDIDECAYENFFSANVDEKAQSVLDIIAQPHETWEQNSPRKLALKSLHADAAVWAHFMRCSLMPTSHNSSLSFHRQVFLYLVLRKQKMNLGRIISDCIFTCAHKKEGCLVFPCLITDLMTRAGVVKLNSDVIEKKSQSLDKIAVERIRKNVSNEKRTGIGGLDAAASSQFMQYFEKLETKLDEILEMQKKLMEKVEDLEKRQLKMEEKQLGSVDMQTGRDGT